MPGCFDSFVQLCGLAVSFPWVHLNERSTEKLTSSSTVLISLAPISTSARRNLLGSRSNPFLALPRPHCQRAVQQRIRGQRLSGAMALFRGTRRGNEIPLLGSIPTAAKERNTSPATTAHTQVPTIIPRCKITELSNS